MKVVALEKMDRYFPSTFIKAIKPIQGTLISCCNYFKKDTISRDQRDGLKVNSTHCLLFNKSWV